MTTLAPPPSTPPSTPPGTSPDTSATRDCSTSRSGSHRAGRAPEHGTPALPLAAWAAGVPQPYRESRRSLLLARVGGVVATAALVGYLVWRIVATLPPAGPWRWAAWLLVAFEALPLLGSATKMVTWWTLDGPTAPPVSEPPLGMRVAVLIPTYNEPVQVVAPTIAAARALEPAHETWVLDDGDRPWLAELCRTYDVRYVTREQHDHAKAGNINAALALMAREEAAGAPPIDLVAVLDCDHVPLPGFLTSTLGYFEDEHVALVQAPQNFYNAGAFDDDGYTGEQGLFFNVQLAARQQSGAGTFWCGSSSVLRVAALRAVGGVASDTVTEDMHTTLRLQRDGWRTVYHHQTVALGLAPETPDQYLVQRRRWGMGAMQVLVHERLWRRQRFLSARTQFEYLIGALWWLEGLGTIITFAIPAVLLVSGAATSTAPPLTFLMVFVTCFTLRLWGFKLLLRRQIQWRTAFALRVLRVPVGLACLWWLISRQTLEFSVTPKGAAHRRYRGRVPAAVVGLAAAAAALLGYAALGVHGLVPWRTDAPSTVTSGLWVAVSAGVLLHAIRRITAEQYATSRRAAHRFAVPSPVQVAGSTGELVDVSVNGLAVRLDLHQPEVAGAVSVILPGAEAMTLEVAERPGRTGVVKLAVRDDDWPSLRALSLWLFHTPAGGVAGLPDGIPAVAVTGRR